MIETVTQTGICRIILNRPEKKNALTSAMYDRLGMLLRSADAEDAVRVVQIESSGADFCAGNDIADFLMQSRQDAATSEQPAGLRFLDTLIGFGKPIVAAVGGVAIGIGTTMLLHCDIVVASEDAMFGLPFVKLGLVPEAASSLLLPQLMGYRRAAELLLLGDNFNASTAYELRLVNRVVPVDELHVITGDYAARLAARPPEALRLSRQLLRGDLAAVRAAKNREAAIFVQRLSSPEAAASLNAFLSRSRPG
ncbi:MAG: enoyl-CoA hydratase-related protein [Janthinobacterium lividum]